MYNTLYMYIYKLLLTVVHVVDVGVVAELSVEVGHHGSNVLRRRQPLMQEIAHV